MVSQPERRTTRSSDLDNTSQVKRKSSSTHQSPTAPSTCVVKKTDAAVSKTSTKTQTKLIPSLKAVVKSSSTTSTATSRTIKQEKINNAPKTPSNKTSPITLSRLFFQGGKR